jgi:1-aminocyclopropane-1-carboxylate deaminase/D-cysteine desulfhydrase-like pyridoxal-dependent ACC family enzyme
MSAHAEAAHRLRSLPRHDFFTGPSAVHELPRLRRALGAGPRLFIKRDDAIPFGFGGNKVRKLAFIAAKALSDGADTLMTVGGVQSNHCRATAAAAATLGLRCVLVLNGSRPDRLSGNLLLDSLLGAETHFVPGRADRAPTMAAIAERSRAEGGRPFEIPLGASTPLGALGLALAVGELADQGMIPDVIVHASSSGGTQAGLAAGCALFGLPTRVLGVSADEPAAALQAEVRSIVEGIGALLGVDGSDLAAACPLDVDDGRVGDGYGVPTPASREAADLFAKHEAVFVDHTYTAKAAAGLIAGLRAGAFEGMQSVLFWHTGGQVGLFAV